jgi:hypothetical protein
VSFRKIAGLAVLALAAIVGGTVPAVAAGPDGGPKGGSITMSVEPGPLDVLAASCGGKSLDIDISNKGSSGAFVDVFITPEKPLITSHDVISTYVPPNRDIVVRTQVTAPAGAAGGTYDIALRLGARGSRAKTSVAVTPKPSGPGANLALGGPVTASSTHGNFSACGAVDGNTNSADWDTLTGWNDGTSRVWPDTFTVDFGGPQQFSRVVLYTLDSERYPAARYGLRDFDVQVMRDGEWATVQSVRGNTQGVREFALDPVVSTTSVRILALASNNSDYSRIVELEVYQES